MNLTRASHDPVAGLQLTIDDLRFAVGDKLSVLEAGYAVLLAEDAAGEAWLAANTGGLPASSEWAALPAPGFVNDPVVVELALRAWHGELGAGEVPVPTVAEAVAALAGRGLPRWVLVEDRLEERS